ERVADFMKEPIAPVAEQPAVVRNETKRTVAEPQAIAAVAASASAAGAGVGVALPPATTRSGRRAIDLEPDDIDEDDGKEMGKSDGKRRVGPAHKSRSTCRR